MTGDIEQFSYNTSISAFMICVNELFGMKCSKKEILNQFIIVLAPFLRTYAKSCGRHWAMQAPYAMPSGRYATSQL